MELRNRKLIGWKIWYGDGTVLTSDFNKWIDTPQKNVQVVKLFYSSDSGFESNLYHNQEYYILDSLLEVAKEIKLGKGINRDIFDKILLMAENDSKIVKDMI